MRTNTAQPTELNSTNPSPAHSTMQDWRLLPNITDRQLVTVLGFVAVIAYAAVTILSWTLLVTAPYGHRLPVIVATVATSIGPAAGLAGLLAWQLRRRRRRRTHRPRHAR